MLLSDILSLTSETEIKKLLTEDVYETLTANDPQIVVNAIERAGVQIFAILKGCGIENLRTKDREVVKLALEKLTLYEIATHADVELSYENEKKQALEILKAYFNCDKDKERVSAIVKQDEKVKRLKTWDVI